MKTKKSVFKVKELERVLSLLIFVFMLTSFAAGAWTLDTDFGLSGYFRQDNAALGNKGTTQDDYIYGVNTDAAGDVYLTGKSIGPSTYNDMVVWKLLPNGNLDTSFNSPKGFLVRTGDAGGTRDDSGKAIMISPYDGKLYVAGYSSDASNYYAATVWCFNLDGTLNTATFNPGKGYVTMTAAAGAAGDNQLLGMAIQGDGKIVVSGASASPANGPDMAVWRFNSNGTIDTTFNSPKGYFTHAAAAGGGGLMTDLGYAVTVTAAGKIVVAGYSYNNEATTNFDMAVWVLKPDGTLDTGFNSGLGYFVHKNAAGGSMKAEGAYSVVVDNNGKYVVGGYAINATGNKDLTIWRLNDSGSALDTSFNGTGFRAIDISGSDDYAYSVRTDSSNRIIFAGNSNANVVVGRLNSDGSNDNTFTGSTYYYGYAIPTSDTNVAYGMCIDQLGRIVTGGTTSLTSNYIDVAAWRFYDGMVISPTPTPTTCSQPMPAGKTGMGANNYTGSSGVIKATRFYMPEDGYAFGGLLGVNTAGTYQGRMAIYTDNAGVPGVKIVESGAAALVNGTQSFSMPFTSLPRGTYWAAFMLNGAGLIAYSSANAGDAYTLNSSWGTFPVSMSGATTESYIYTAAIQYCPAYQYWGNRDTFTLLQANNMSSAAVMIDFRFTQKVSDTVNKVNILWSGYAGTSPTYRVAIKADSGGLPTGASITAGTMSAGTGGWKSAAVTNVLLTAGTKYHLLVGYDTGTINGSNYGQIAMGQNTNTYLDPVTSLYDGFSDTLLSNNTGATWLQYGASPIFELEYNTAANDQGKAYSSRGNQPVYGTGGTGNFVKEDFPGPDAGFGSFWAYNMGLYVTRTANVPADNLYYSIYNVSDGVTMTSGTFMTAAEAQQTPVWVEKPLANGVHFITGKQYSLILTSPSGASTSPYMIVGEKLLTAGLPYELVTWLGTSAYMSTSVNGGGAWTAQPGDLSMRFRLGGTPTWTYTMTPTQTPVVTATMTPTITPTSCGLDVTTDTTLTAGNYSFCHVRVYSGYTLSIQGPGAVTITVNGGDFVVEPGAYVSGIGTGFSGGVVMTSGGGQVTQNNAAPDSSSGGGGGGHAGAGGSGKNAVNGGAGYDSPLFPQYSGAGGGGSSAKPGYNGGAAFILYNPAGKVTINGNIEMNGSGYFSGGMPINGAGGGAGGAVNIAAQIIDGTGVVSANGGKGWPNGGGGGSGGLINLCYTGTYNFTGAITANAGPGNGSANGAAGIIYKCGGYLFSPTPTMTVTPIPTPAQGGNRNYRAERITADDAIGVSIKYNSAGLARIAYFDQGALMLKYAEQQADRTWKIRVLDSTPNCGRGASLAIDPGNDLARVSYYDSNNSKVLIARESSPGSWNYEAPFAGASVSGNTSLCIDASGYLCLSYIMDGKFFLTRESSPGSWNAPYNYFSEFTPSCGAIAIEPGGAIQMAARDQATGQIYIAWESAGDMLVESGAALDGVDIKCVNGGDTRIAYTMATGTLVYLVYDGDIHKTYLDNFHCGSGVSLCLDSSANNYPMIAYCVSTDNAIRVAKQESPSSWTISHVGKRSAAKPGVSMDYYPGGDYRGVAWGASLDFGADNPPLNPGATATSTPVGAVYFGNRAAVSGNIGTALDNTSKKASIDFTARQTGSITDIRLYFEFKTGTAGYRVSIQNDDGSGKPDGFAIGGYSANINSAAIAIGWNGVTLSPGPVLTQGVKYHIVIEWDGGSTVDSNNYAVITDGSRPNHMLIPYDQYFDGSLMTSFNSGAGYGVTGYMPIFMYYNSTMASWSGNPYASAAAWEIYGTNYINQAVNLTSASSIKEIGAYVKRTTNNMPVDDLKWEIRTNANTVVASGTLLAKSGSSTSFAWAKATMTPVPLSAGQYYVVLYSNLSTFPDSYTIVAADPVIGAFPYMDATYDGITDFAMYSVNSGANWNQVNSSYDDFPVYLSSGSSSGSTTGTAWYFKSASSDDPSGLASKMDMTVPTGAGTTNSTYPWACPGAIDFSLSVWDTPPVGTHIPAAGQWEFSLHVRDDSATGHYKLKLNVYKYAGGGSWPGTFLFTTTAPGTIPSSMQEVKWTEVNKPDYGFTATDRIYVEVRVVEDGTCPGSTTVDFTYEGTAFAGYIKAPDAGSGTVGAMWHLRDNYSVDPCCSIVREMKTLAPTGGSTYVQNTTINCCQAAGYTQFIREWDSEQVGANIPGAGTWNFSIRSAESSGSNWGYRIRAEVFKYPAGGPIPAVPLFTTDSPIIPSGLTSTLAWSMASQPDFGFTSTDRIYIKFYALVAAASPPSATVNIYYESTSDDSWVQPPGSGSGGTGTDLFLWTDFALDPASARMLHATLPPGPVQSVSNWVGPYGVSEIGAWTTGPLYNTVIDPGDWKFNFYGYETGGGVCVNYQVDVYDYSGTVPGSLLFSSPCASLLSGAAALYTWTSARGSTSWTPGHSLYFSVKAYNSCGTGRWVYLDYNGASEYSEIAIPAAILSGGTPTPTPTPTAGQPASTWHLRSYLSDDPNIIPALSQNPPTGTDELLTYSAPNCPSIGSVFHLGGWDSPVLGAAVPGAGVWKFFMYGGDPSNSNAYYFRVDVFKYAGGGGAPGTLLMSSISPSPIPGTTGPVIWQETWPDFGFTATDRIYIIVSAQVVGSCPASSMLGIIYDSPGNDSRIDVPAGQGTTPTPTPTNTALPVPTEIFYSVGVDMSDHKTGSPLASVSGGAITFTIPQTDARTGIGDEVIINSGSYILYLTRKINTSTWEAMNSNGGAPADFTNMTVTSIKRSFSNMAYAVSGAGDGTHLNFTDLVTMNKRINIVCYNDGVDSVAFGLSGYTTDQARNINIFAPWDTATQCNSRQAHTGTAGTGYTINTSGYTGMGTVDVWQPYTQFTNIAFTGWAGGGNAGIRIGSDGVVIYKCLITNPTGTDATQDAIKVIASGINLFVVNSFIYGIPRSALNIPDNMTGVHAVFDSNTVVNAHSIASFSGVPAIGFASAAVNNSGSVVDVTDSYVHALNYNCFGTGGSGIINGNGHNASADATAPGTGSLVNQLNSSQFISVNPGSEDLHLKTGSSLIGQGYDMSSKYTEDIDGATRTAPWDIGADEYGVSGFTPTATPSVTQTPTVTQTPCINGDISFNGTGEKRIDRGFGDFAFGMAIDSLGRIVISGRSDASGNTMMAVWRVNSDGTSDNTFGPAGYQGMDAASGSNDEALQGVAIDPADKPIAAGYRFNGTGYDGFLVKFADGSIDSSWASGGIVMVPNAGFFDIKYDSNGKIVAAGAAIIGGNPPDAAIFRFNADGSPDTTFNSPNGYVSWAGGANGMDVANRVMIDSNGSIIITGETDNGTNKDMFVMRYNSDGSPDTGFNGNGRVIFNHGLNDGGNGLAIDRLGRILVSGYIEAGAATSTAYDMAVWRFNTDGTPDTSFNGTGWLAVDDGFGGSDRGFDIKVDANFRIVIAGSTYSPLTGTDMTIWRGNEDGSPDLTFNNGKGDMRWNGFGNGYDEARNIMTDPQNRLVVSGYSLNGTNMDAMIWRGKDGCTVYYTPTNTPTMKPSYTATPTATASVTQTMTRTATATVTATYTSTPSFTPTKTATQTASPTATGTGTATQTASPTMTQTVTQTITQTATPTITGTATPTITQTATPTCTVSQTATQTETQTSTQTATQTITQTVTPTITGTATPTTTQTSTPTYTVSQTATQTATQTTTQTATQTITQSVTPTITGTATPTITQTVTPTYTVSQTATQTATQTTTQTATQTITQSITPTITETATPTITQTVTPTYTVSQTATQTATQTTTQTATQTITQSITPTITETATPTITQTATPTYTVSQTATQTATQTTTQTATQTITQTVTPTITGTATPTITQTATPTYTVSQTATQTMTQTVTVTITQTATPTVTPSETCGAVGQFGRTTNGGSNWPASGDVMNASKYVLGQDGTVLSVAINVHTGSAPYYIRVAIYDNSGPGGSPGNLIAQSAAQPSVGGAWNSFDMPNTFLTAGTYWLAFLCDNTYVNIYFANGTSGDAYYNSPYTPSGGFPGSFGTGTIDSVHWSIYANFCAASGSINTPTPTVTLTSTRTYTLTATATITHTVTQTVTQTATPTSTVTPTVTQTVTETVTQTVTETVTETATPTFTETATLSATQTSTPTFTATQTITQTITPTVTQTVTPTVTATVTQTVTQTVTGTVTETATPTVTDTASPTSTATATITATITATVTQTASPTITQTATPTATVTPTFTDTPVNSPTGTPSATVTQTDSATYTATGTYTATFTDTQTATATITETATPTDTQTVTQTETPTFTATETITDTITGTVTPTVTPTITHTHTPTYTATPTGTGTVTETITPTATQTDTPTATATQSDTPTATGTVTATATGTITPTNTPTGTETATPSDTVTPSVTQTYTPTQTITATITPTTTGTITPTVTPTLTDTATGSPTDTVTSTATPTFTNTPVDTFTYTATATGTPTYTVTQTDSPTYTNTPTPTQSGTQTYTVTPSATPTHTDTYTNTPTYTMTRTITPTYTPTGTNSVTDTPTFTLTVTDTPTFTATPTGTATYTGTPTDTNTPTYTPTMTPTFTATPQNTFTFTATNTGTFTVTPSRTVTGTFTITMTLTITQTFTSTPTPNDNKVLDKNYVDVSKGETLKIKIKATGPGIPVKIKIYNLTGEYIRSLEYVTYAIDWNDFDWDVKNNSGKVVGQGLYFVYMEFEGQKTIRRVYIVK